jgi:hypothetical protein
MNGNYTTRWMGIYSLAEACGEWRYANYGNPPFCLPRVQVKRYHIS